MDSPKCDRTDCFANGEHGEPRGRCSALTDNTFSYPCPFFKSATAYYYELKALDERRKEERRKSFPSVIDGMPKEKGGPV